MWAFDPKLSPFIEELHLIAVGQLSRFSVDPGYPKLRCRVVSCQLWQHSSLVVEGMKVRQCSSEAQRQRIGGTLSTLCSGSGGELVRSRRIEFYPARWRVELSIRIGDVGHFEQQEATRGALRCHGRMAGAVA
jgi:hypothetical protein